VALHHPYCLAGAATTLPRSHRRSVTTLSTETSSSSLPTKKILTLFSEFFAFLSPKNSFPGRKHENKEKRLFYFSLRILLPIQIQLLNIKKSNKSKIDFPYYAMNGITHNKIRISVKGRKSVSGYLVRHVSDKGMWTYVKKPVLHLSYSFG
jgi:hypothetical protein